jgi:hypothetical protein
MLDPARPLLVAAVHRADVDHKALHGGVYSVEPRHHHHRIVLQGLEVGDHPFDLAGEKRGTTFAIPAAPFADQADRSYRSAGSNKRIVPDHC